MFMVFLKEEMLSCLHPSKEVIKPSLAREADQQLGFRWQALALL
jgi:hypothetical protein